MTKKCKTCSEMKSVSDFCKDKLSKDGLSRYCRKCTSVRKKARRSKDLKTERKYNVANREKVTTMRNKYKEDNKDRVKKTQVAYYVANREKLVFQANEYNRVNREAVLARKRAYKKRNLAACAAENAKRKAAKLGATPPWSETKEIVQFYKNRPFGMEIDHIIPLRGDKYGVCGLHVIDNLQYLTPEENRRKGNKFYPEEHFWIRDNLKVA